MVRALIEVAATQSGELPVSLLHLAYRASDRAEVVLAMRREQREGVDRALDSVVTLDSLHVHGVRYVDVESAGQVEELAREAGLVVAVSDDLRSRLRAAGVPWCDVTEATRSLAARAD